jgi:hypothetical protein
MGNNKVVYGKTSWISVKELLRRKEQALEFWISEDKKIELPCSLS